MSKRFIFKQQYGERKKTKLDVSISDHNFPLSQNPGSSKELQNDNWGDENDDEILLLASQACEDAYNVNDISQLPDYSLCMQPPTTSTQLPQPSISKDNFSFKKPTSVTNMKDKFAITPDIMPKRNEAVNFTDDLIFNEKIYQGQDSSYMYRQMLQLQEENAKLKSENGKLLEKCVTKEGEASILRTQLKTSHISVDNARLEKMRAQEKMQMEWNEKLTAANLQMQDLKNQLDFKNLEIISVKERCKMLDSNKVKLTQVHIPASDISSSQRPNYSMYKQNEFVTQSKRVKVSSSAAQTEGHAQLLKLNKVFRTESSGLEALLPLALQPTSDDAPSILYSSETLRRPADYTQNRCEMYSTVHRIAAGATRPASVREKRSISCVQADLTRLAAGADTHSCDNIISSTAAVLQSVCAELEDVSSRVTSAFRREMDERHVNATSRYRGVGRRELVGGESLYKDEQAILARRMTAILGYIVDSAKDQEVVRLLIDKKYFCEITENKDKSGYTVLDYICRICRLVDSNSCAILYSGVLLSFTILLEALLRRNWSTQIHLDRLSIESCVLSSKGKLVVELIQYVITSRPHASVSCRLISLLRKYALYDMELLDKLCSGNAAGNLKTDYEQGVLLYKKDSCHLQVFLKEIEAALKCMERQKLIDEAACTTNNLIALHSNLNIEHSSNENKRCECRLVMGQVLVYALQICAVMLQKHAANLDSQQAASLSGVCRAGVLALHCRAAAGPAGGAGRWLAFLHACGELRGALRLTEMQGNLLSGLVSTVQPPIEECEVPSPTHRQAWVDSFSKFSLTD